MICPSCREELEFIEVCESSDDEVKKSYACHNEMCEWDIVYVVGFVITE